MLVVLTVCAITSTVLMVRREGASSTSDTRQSMRGPPQHVGNWRTIAAAGTWQGTPDAAVIITEFSDFQCPFCRRLAGVLDSLRTKYSTAIAISYRHVPIARLHPFARAAALAAECAANQGRFQQFHDGLFAAQDSIGRIPWNEFARRSGVTDVTAFDACLQDSVPLRRLVVDDSVARALKVRGTPTVLVNDLRLAEPATFARLDSLVAAALLRSARKQ
jgi:protein-disulfide isomerase